MITWLTIFASKNISSNLLQLKLNSHSVGCQVWVVGHVRVFSAVICRPAADVLVVYGGLAFPDHSLWRSLWVDMLFDLFCRCLVSEVFGGHRFWHITGRQLLPSALCCLIERIEKIVWKRFKWVFAAYPQAAEAYVRSGWMTVLMTVSLVLTLVSAHLPMTG